MAECPAVFAFPRFLLLSEWYLTRTLRARELWEEYRAILCTGANYTGITGRGRSAVSP